MKKITMILFLVLSIVTVPISANEGQTQQESGTMHLQNGEIEVRTPEDIRRKAREYAIPFGELTTYEEKPSTVSPYKAGAVSNESLKDALNLVNLYRYIAGLPADIELNPTYNEYAQYGSVLLDASEFSHTPAKPEDMDEAFYTKAYKGISSSNIGYGFFSITSSIMSYMHDSKESNIASMRNRRWLLSPTMKSIGFGKAGNKTATYALDESRQLSYDHITWPAEYTPYELFSQNIDSDTAFSISLNPEIYDLPKLNDLNVHITNKKTGSVIEINQNTINDELQLYVSDSEYGKAYAIIFYFGSIDEEDQYEITISGLKRNGVKTSLTYQTTFFQFNLDETANPDNFTYYKDTDQVIIKDYEGFGGTVTVPDVIEGLPVTELTNYAFSYMDNITQLNLPSTLKRIGNYSFRGMSRLEKLYIPEGVTILGNSAFNDCTALKEISFPSTLESFEDVLNNNSNLKKIIIYNDDITLSSQDFDQLNKNVEFICGKGSATEREAKARGFNVSYYQAVEHMNVTPTDIIMNEKDLAKVSVEVLPSNAFIKSISYEVKDKKIAEVDQNGNVTALSPGKTELIVTINHKVTASCTITVRDPEFPKKITLNLSDQTLTEGDYIQLKAVLSPSAVLNKNVTWKSSTAAVASVDKQGNVKALHPGATYITATTANGLEAKCLIKVISNDPKMNVTNATLSIGNGFQAKVTNATSAIVWRSSTPSVASVDQNGNVKALRAGSTYIIAKTSEGKEVKCLVKVVEIQPISVSMNLSNATLSIGKTFNAKATVYPTNATNKNVAWSSGNTNVVKVDANGKVTTVGAGTTYVYAKTSNGITGKILVKVLPNPTSVTITPKSATVRIGATFKARGIVTPSNAATAFTFKSSSPSIATVDANGNVKAIKAGYTYISVTTTNGKTAKFLLRVVK